MKDNKEFWSRAAVAYEAAILAGPNARLAYNDMLCHIIQYLMKDMVVLEAAAGPGVLSRQMASHCKSLIATDFSEKMIRKAYRAGVPQNCLYMVQDVTNLSFSDEKFDAVVIANALHVMPDPKKALREIHRVLKPEGTLIAPTFIREEGKHSVSEEWMKCFGLKIYHPWTKEEYIDFIVNGQFSIIEKGLIYGHSFPICFVAAKKR